MSGEVLWRPEPSYAAGTAMARFMAVARAPDWPSLHRWSVDERETFWTLLWEFCGVRGEKGPCALADGERMPGARFFPEGKLNFAENLLGEPDDATAIVFRSEQGIGRRLTRRDLAALVARLAARLRAEGVSAGDRVAGYLPNLPEAVAAMLAATSLGAVWSSCSPDFGVQGVLDRFGQIEPKVLFCADRYGYGGKEFRMAEKNAAVAERLPSLRASIQIRYADGAIADLPPAAPLPFERFPFNHPLYILYSSGTTGVPKCIVHGAGGTLLQHLKEHRLHSDLRPGDRLFYFTTLGWMMWNWLVSGLASGATLFLYDGSPFAERGRVLFDWTEAEAITHFGTSAKYLDAIAKIGLCPARTHRLEALRMLLSTGSPLSPEGFDWVYANVKRDVCLASISGGTDIVSCFVLGNPLLPVRRGEIQCKGLGMAVAVYDEAGRPVIARKGELVCTRPFPSMPLGFWNDPDGSRYRAAYFEHYPGVWRHGDWCEETEHGGFVIVGRSDAVLNPGGVRIGTAEIYRVVETLDEVVEALVVGQEWENDVRVVLFVRLREGLALDDALAAKMRARIREATTPRHVPDKILQVPDIPRTKSGKIVELAVRELIHGRPVKNVEALANPEALAYFRDRPELSA